MSAIKNYIVILSKMYVSYLRTDPTKTKMITAGTMFTLSDFIV